MTQIGQKNDFWDFWPPKKMPAGLITSFLGHNDSFCQFLTGKKFFFSMEILISNNIIKGTPGPIILATWAAFFLRILPICIIYNILPP